MKKFAKLFQDGEIGQVLVMLCLTGEDQPQIKFHFDPGIEGMGLSATGIEFPDSPNGEESAIRAFEGIDEEAAIRVAKATIAEIKRMFDEDVPHPLSGIHINRGSMDAAADAYEAEYNAAHHG